MYTQCVGPELPAGMKALTTGMVVLSMIMSICSANRASGGGGGGIVGPVAGGAVGSVVTGPAAGAQAATTMNTIQATNRTAINFFTFDNSIRAIIGKINKKTP